MDGFRKCFWLVSSIIFIIVEDSSIPFVSAVPLIAEVGSMETQCLRYNIPTDDDAHMIFLVLSEDDDAEEIEDFFVKQVSDLSKEALKGDKVQTPEVPKYIKDMLKSKGNSNLEIEIQKPRKPILRKQRMVFNAPLVVRNVVATAGSKGQGWDPPLGGYSICLRNNNREDKVSRVIFDVVLAYGSDDDDDDSGKKSEEHKKKREAAALKKEHLTPLQLMFDRTVNSAEQILSEMKYMERREKYMRKTIDSTNSRIKYFSYMSVLVLIGVAFLQVTYLKSYFKKKKLM